MRDETEREGADRAVGAAAALLPVAAARGGSAPVEPAGSADFALHLPRFDDDVGRLFELRAFVALLLASLAIVGVGARTGSALHLLFPLVVLGLAVTRLLVFLRAPTDPMTWFHAHSGGMVGSSIAALTAFLVVDAARIQAWVPLPRIALWLGPTLVGVPFLLAWQRRDRRRFRRAAPPEKPGAPP